jgi:hypothetical protein
MSARTCSLFSAFLPNHDSELYWRNTVSTPKRDILLFHVIGSLVLILLRFTIIIFTSRLATPNFSAAHLCVDTWWDELLLTIMVMDRRY